MRRKAPDFPIAPILEYLGAENVPHIKGSGHRKMSCFLHDDKSPSASVGQYSYICFSCGVTGDAIKLLRAQGGEPDYQSAVRRAEEIVGGSGHEVSRPDSGGWSGRLLD